MATLTELVNEAYEAEQTKRLGENREILRRPPRQAPVHPGQATGGVADPQMDPWTPDQRQRFKEGLDRQVRNEDLTAPMNKAEKIGAGLWSGAQRIRDGALNAIGMMGDEEVRHNRMLDTDLSDDTFGSYGQFGGEMVALSPLGVVGRGARKLHAVSKTRNLATRDPGFFSKRVEGFSTPGMAATYDSALAGAVAADPNERGSGAALGGTAGGFMNKIIQGTGRIFRRGLAEKSPSMKSIDKTTKRELGSEGFVPLTQATGGAGDSITAGTRSAMDAVSMMPKARQAMETQSVKAMDDMYELALRRAFNAGPKRDAAIKVFKQTGDMQMALDAGGALDKSGKKYATHKILDEAGAGKKRGRFEPTHLTKAAEKAEAAKGNPKSRAEMRELGNTFSDVLEDQNIGTSNVESRMLYHKASKRAEGLMGGVGATVDKLPFIGPMLGSKSFQNFLMGNTKAQKLLRRVMRSKGGEGLDELLDLFRRTTAAQPVSSDEASDFMTPQDMVKNTARQAKEKVDALRGTE